MRAACRRALSKNFSHVIFLARLQQDENVDMGILSTICRFVSTTALKIRVLCKITKENTVLCAIYKSNKKTSTYLYISQKDQFDSVPESLLSQFGQPIFVMMLDLCKREKLAQANIDKVKASLLLDGYFLQLPPPLEGSITNISRHNYKI